MRNTLRQNIEISRQKYLLKLSRKFTCSEINPKCYWFISNNFLNNKKIPCIHPVINKNKLPQISKKKANLTHSWLNNKSLLKTEARYVLTFGVK